MPRPKNDLSWIDAGECTWQSRVIKNWYTVEIRYLLKMFIIIFNFNGRFMYNDRISSITSIKVDKHFKSHHDELPVDCAISFIISVSSVLLVRPQTALIRDRQSAACSSSLTNLYPFSACNITILFPFAFVHKALLNKNDKQTTKSISPTCKSDIPWKLYLDQ